MAIGAKQSQILNVCRLTDYNLGYRFCVMGVNCTVSQIAVFFARIWPTNLAKQKPKFLDCLLLSLIYNLGVPLTHLMHSLCNLSFECSIFFFIVHWSYRRHRRVVGFIV